MRFFLQKFVLKEKAACESLKASYAVFAHLKPFLVFSSNLSNFIGIASCPRYSCSCSFSCSGSFCSCSCRSPYKYPPYPRHLHTFIAGPGSPRNPAPPAPGLTSTKAVHCDWGQTQHINVLSRGKRILNLKFDGREPQYVRGPGAVGLTT